MPSALHDPGSYIENLNEYGFALIVDSTVPKLNSIALELGSGASPWHTIAARNQTEARPLSLSSIYGRAAFPWHTDGAIAREVPRYIIMYCDESELVEPTEILSLKAEAAAELRNSMARTTLVVSDTHHGKWYTSALSRATNSSEFMARWDMRTCRPAGSRHSRRVAAALATAEPTGSINWLPGVAALIDNYETLHRRPAVCSPSRVLNRRYIFR